VIEVVLALSHELRGLVHDQLQLAALETRLLLRNVLTMVVIAIFSAIVLVSAWLALIGAAIFGLISIGIAPIGAMLLAAAANLLLALACWMLIRCRSNRLGWPATLRTLAPGPSSADQDPPGADHLRADASRADASRADTSPADDARVDHPREYRAS
jgi:hypothetical protein